VSCDSQNILSPPCESLKIFYFLKYRIYGATINKSNSSSIGLTSNILIDDLDLLSVLMIAYELRVILSDLITCYENSRLNVLR
jgi:hypothetical protein